VEFAVGVGVVFRLNILRVINPSCQAATNYSEATRLAAVENRYSILTRNPTSLTLLPLICLFHISGKLLCRGNALVLQQLNDATNLSIQCFKIREDFLKNLFRGATFILNLLDSQKLLLELGARDRAVQPPPVQYSGAA